MDLKHFSNICLLVMLCYFQTCKSQEIDEVCLCHHPNYTKVWGEFLATTPCEGICDLATQTGRRECYANGPQGETHQQVCTVQKQCTKRETCEGNWSPWSVIGDCLNSCTQLQVRYCYKYTEFGNVRSTKCEGGNGNQKKTRKIPCDHGDCRRSNSFTTTLPTTTTTTTNSKMTVTTRRIIEAARTSEKSNEPKDESNDSEQKVLTTTLLPPTENPNKTSSQLNTLILPAILGSVGFVCVAVVIIIGVVTCSHRRKVASDHPYTQGKENSSMTNRSENYEVVGPPLPVRPVSMQIPTAPPPDHPENVTNMLYHTMNIFSEGNVHSKGSGKENNNGYLIPQDFADSSHPDAVYSHIDDRT